MPTFLTDTNPSSEKMLPFSLPNDATCGYGYRNIDPQVEINILGRSLAMPAKRARKTLPEGWEKPPTTSGLYRFEITTADAEKPEVYIGKASSLLSRLGDYVEMTRRLLGLYQKHPQWTDKNGFRYVHYRLADAVINNAQIQFFYLERANLPSRQDLARQELLEISHATLAYHQVTATLAHRCVLNAYDSLRSESHTQFTDRWAEVRSLLPRAAPNARAVARTVRDAANPQGVLTT